MSKICNICNTKKELTDFHKSSQSPDGYRGDCKICRKKETKIYYKENKELVNKRAKEHRDNNKELTNERSRIYRENNKEKVNESHKKYRENNKEKIKQYREDNKDALREGRRRYKIKRFKEDKLYKLKHNISSLIRLSFKKYNYSKESRTHEILGCSYEDFKNHIELQWEDWMNWDNYGKYNGNENYGWDMDHIIPVSSALNEGDIIRLNHHTNLQPLCSKVNRDIKKDSKEVCMENHAVKQRELR